MKYRILFFLLVFGMFPSVFAENSISLSSEKSQVSLGENFEIQVQIQTQDSQVVDIRIPGIENFDVFSTQQSQQVQIYNEQVRNKFTLILQLQPKAEGNFSLGPITYGTGGLQVSSQKLDIEVGKEKTISASGTQEDIIFHDELRKPHSKVFLFLAFGLGILFFMGLFYVVAQKYFATEKPKNPQKNPEPLEMPSFRERLLGYYEDSKEQDESSFYIGLNTLLREYFSSLGVHRAYEKTYQELSGEKKIPLPLREHFAQSYYAEFDTGKDTPEKRKQIFEDILSQF